MNQDQSIDALEKIVRQKIKEGEDAQYRIPYLDRLLENFRLLLNGDYSHKIKINTAKKLKVAIMLHVLFLDSIPEEPKNFLAKYKLMNFREEDSSDIVAAIEHCEKTKRSAFIKSKQASAAKNAVATLLAFLLYMDELGTESYSLYMTIENYARGKDRLEIFGNISAQTLKDALEATRKVRSFPEMELKKDDSVVARALISLLMLPYFFASARSWLNEDIKKELERRTFALRTEVERIIARKKQNEKSLLSAGL